MKNRVLSIAYRKLASLGSDEQGAILVITLAIFFFLFMLVSGVYTIGEAVHRRIELQNACDAAAYSAAVVQADGLSRMSVVNRAMAWTYVQMVRRQLDYITYRWLKLTYKQFKEDRDNAEDWHFCLLPCDENHDQDGVGWWCGQGGKGGMDIIRMNHRFNVKLKDLKKVLDDMDSSMGDGSGSSSSSGGFGGGSGSGSNGSGGGSGNSMFSDSDSLFGVGDLNPVKSEVYDKIQEAAKAGKELGPSQIEQIYKDIYTRSYPEPDPNETDQFGNNIGKAKWEAWYKNFKLFASVNKITEGDYCCKICGKPMAGFSHSQCIQNQMNSFNSQGQQQQQQQQSSSSGNATSKYKWGNKMAEQIKNDKKTIEIMNLSLDAISMNMMLGMKEAARNVLEYNLPKDQDGGISGDFLYSLHIPTGSNPYGASQSGDASLSGIFSPVYNTEEYETLFLNMMDGQVHDSLVKYFMEDKSGLGGILDGISSGLSGLLGGGDKGGGVDQWFIRTYPAETMKDNEKNIKPTDQSYYAEGISRSYKNANREEGKCLLGQSRSNHTLSIGDSAGIGGGDDMFGLGSIFSAILDSIKQQIDLSPTCLNRRSRFPEMCRKVNDSVALVSQYRWCSAKWFCFFVVYPFGIKWYHPFFPKFYCSDHGYGFIWIMDQFDALFNGKTRSDYRNCFMGFDDTFILKGHARIYGDDRDLVDENYAGTPARPWLLNEKFFNGGGTISVGLARRQRNPWQRLLSWFNNYDADSPNLSNGLMSLFNVNDSNFLWTTSTARAAYRRPNDSSLGSLSYDMRFDVSAWPEALEIDYASGASKEMKQLRVGCVCDKGDNAKRLRQAWNLGTPDWDATLLPVRYSKDYISKYESWKENGGSWTTASNEGQGVFEILSGMSWNGLGEHSSLSVPGSAIMQTTNQDGKELGNLKELLKLKIY